MRSEHVVGILARAHVVSITLLLRLHAVLDARVCYEADPLEYLENGRVY